MREIKTNPNTENIKSYDFISELSSVECPSRIIKVLCLSVPHNLYSNWLLQSHHTGTGERKSGSSKPTWSKQSKANLHNKRHFPKTNNQTQMGRKILEFQVQHLRHAMPWYELQLACFDDMTSCVLSSNACGFLYQIYLFLDINSTLYITMQLHPLSQTTSNLRECVLLFISCYKLSGLQDLHEKSWMRPLQFKTFTFYMTAR